MPYDNSIVYSFSDWDRKSSVKKYISSRSFFTFTTRNNKKNLLPLDPQIFHLDPWFITGFIDAEGCFSIRVRKSKKTLIGWNVEAVFSINLHSRDLPLLKVIKAYFGGIGRITEGKNNCGYFVSSIEQLTTVIIPHFVKYPLITQKLADFLLFRSVVNIVNTKEHLTMKGLQKIVSLKASINLGLNDELKAAFPDTVPAVRYLAESTKILAKAKSSVNYEIPLTTPGSSKLMKVGQWMAGFVSGDGCFSVTENKSSSKVYVRLVFNISQHSRDSSLISSFVDFFSCGVYRSTSANRTTVYFECLSFSDNYEKIMPFFREFNIIGAKSKDFYDWCKVAKIIKAKDHLTKEGFDLVCQIKSEMNKGR